MFDLANWNLFLYKLSLGWSKERTSTLAFGPSTLLNKTVCAAVCSDRTGTKLGDTLRFSIVPLDVLEGLLDVEETTEADFGAESMTAEEYQVEIGLIRKQVHAVLLSVQQKPHQT
jgi:hypothetical protein